MDGGVGSRWPDSAGGVTLRGGQTGARSGRGPEERSRPARERGPFAGAAIGESPTSLGEPGAAQHQPFMRRITKDLGAVRGRARAVRRRPVPGTEGRAAAAGPSERGRRTRTARPAANVSRGQCDPATTSEYRHTRSCRAHSGDGSSDRAREPAALRERGARWSQTSGARSVTCELSYALQGGAAPAPPRTGEGCAVQRRALDERAARPHDDGPRAQACHALNTARRRAAGKQELREGAYTCTGRWQHKGSRSSARRARPAIRMRRRSRLAPLITSSPTRR